MIEGAGAPEGGEFERSPQALYGVAYTMKFERKHAGYVDVPINPLEGDWWVNGPNDAMRAWTATGSSGGCG